VTEEKKVIEIGPDKPAPLHLPPGSIIWRWTEEMKGGGGLVIVMPCHEDQIIVTDHDTTDATAVCLFCHNTYDLTILDENDGGYGARFVVAHRQFILSLKTGKPRKRAPK
jgi:hypothetical protein